MKNLLRPQTAVKWLPWSRVAFDRARDEGKVILLSLATAWSQACQAMDEQCYADRATADEINTWFVPIRVDADRRPDIADRYELGGLPTIAFLNVDGEILGGGTFVPRDRLMSALTRLHDGSPALSAPNFQLPTPKESQAANEGAVGVGSWELGIDELTNLVFATFDRQHGGFGGSPKFPLAAPARLAVQLAGESGSREMSDCATRTLDAFGWSPLYDDADGGFFRCAANADWGQPQREKLLITNAILLDLFLEGGVAMHNERWLARAADVLDYVSRLTDAPGEGWRASESSDGARLSDANARMVSATLHASRVFEDQSLGELALQSLESVLLASYRPGHGVAHCAGGIRGLLTDHVAMLRAQLDAWDVTGSVVYQMMGQELAQYAIRTMWDAEQGGFFDRAASSDEGEFGLLTRPLKPFALNCEAAEALHRLSHAAEDPEYARLAGATLDAVHTRAAQQGPLAAHYVLARRALSR